MNRLIDAQWDLYNKAMEIYNSSLMCWKNTEANQALRIAQDSLDKIYILETNLWQ